MSGDKFFVMSYFKEFFVRWFSNAPLARKVVTPVNSILRGLMEQLSDSIQPGCSC